MSSVLVTGATGFVGRALCTELAARGYAVRAGVRTGTAPLPGPWQPVVIGDLGGAAGQAPSLAGVDVVVHLAARVHVMNDLAADPLEEFRRVNVEGTRRLAEAAVQDGVRRFIFVSSIKVNGEKTDDAPFQPTDVARPQDAYGRSKYEAEQALWSIASQSGLDVTVVRPPLVYGPGVKGNFERLERWVRSGIPLPLGAVRNKRSLVSVMNLVDLLRVCIEHPRAPGQTFLVSDGEDLSTAELIRRLACAVGRRPRLLPVPLPVLTALGAVTGRRAEIERLCESLQVDITRTRALLGWHPPLSVEEGLRCMIR